MNNTFPRDTFFQALTGPLFLLGRGAIYRHGAWVHLLRQSLAAFQGLSLPPHLSRRNIGRLPFTNLQP